VKYKLRCFNQFAAYRRACHVVNNSSYSRSSVVDVTMMTAMMEMQVVMES
jgi:hypothetical protein